MTLGRILAVVEKVARSNCGARLDGFCIAAELALRLQIIIEELLIS